MGQPKKKTTRRRTGNRRSHAVARLMREVNRHSPVPAVRRRTRRQLQSLAHPTPPATRSKTAKTKPATSVATPPAAETIVKDKDKDSV